jgi:hypothetical protein
MAMFDSWQLTRIWFCIFGRFCLSDAFVLPELPFVSVKPQCLIASTCRSRHTFKAFLMCWDPLFTCILYSYGPFPVISTYNPIYRMYNPIYNQLQLINGHNCTYPGIPSLWFFQISPVSQFIMGTTSFIPGWEWYIVQSCLSPKISSLVEGNMNTGSFHTWWQNTMVSDLDFPKNDPITLGIYHFLLEISSFHIYIYYSH